MISRRIAPVWASLLLLVIGLGACGGDSEPKPTATSAAEPTAVVDTPATQAPLEVVGSTATDGICQVTIPDTWVDDGTGRGATLGGDRWSVFGNAIANDEAWTAAQDLLKSQMADREGAEITETDSVITVVLPNGRGYVVRERFDDRYCEFSVMASQDQPEEITNIWLGIASTLAPRQEP